MRWFLCVASLGVAPCEPLSAAPVPTADFAAARTAILAHMQKNDVPGLAVAVWKDGRILWEEGFGWADRENHVPATAHTMFALASVSKPLTAIGLMTLVQAGKVRLDHPVNDYLRADPVTVRVGEPREVTVERVANHTSGLVASNEWFYGGSVRSVPSMSQRIARYGIVASAPGERYQYSNLGYGILGQLIAQVSGTSYEEFMRREVFLPLGMTHSSVYVASGLEPYAAVRYGFDRKAIPFYVSAEPASAMIYSSAHDLARLGLFLLKDRMADQRAILSGKTLDRMTSDPIDPASHPVIAASREGDGYAIGWDISHEGGYRIVGHTGGMSGVSTVLRLVPEKHAGVVVLSNVEEVGVGDVPQHLLKGLLKWREPPAAAESRPAKPSFIPSGDLVGRWEGEVNTYEGQRPLQLKVLASGEVRVQIGGEPRFAKRSTLSQPALLNDVAFENGVLTGSTLAQLPTSDTGRHPHSVSLNLKLRDGVLDGVATSVSIFDGLWLYSLPYWTELKRVDSAVTTVAGAPATATSLIDELGLREAPMPVRERSDWRRPRRIIVSQPEVHDVAWLREVAPGVELIVADDEKQAVAAAAQADAVIGFCSPELLERGRRIRWMQVMGAGVEHCVRIPAIAERNILVTNMQRVAGPVMAEHVMALTLALARGLPGHIHNQGKAEWPDFDDSPGAIALQGKTLLVAGLGGVGTEVARRAHSFGMRVVATNASGGPAPDFVARVGPPQELEKLAREADVVIDTLPHTPHTERLFDSRMFAAMKPGALFINVGRGKTVDTNALLAALEEKRIAGAGLDVTDPEPLPADHPLWRAPNVIITPHVAPRSDLGRERHWQVVRENLRRYVAGERMLSVVGVERGY